MQVDNKSAEAKVSVSREVLLRRRDILQDVHKYFQKHLSRLPAFIFYTALPQMVARIAHPNPEVFKLLEQIIIKVVDAHPRQALWSLFACMTTRQPSERRTRGLHILANIRNMTQKIGRRVLQPQVSPQDGREACRTALDCMQQWGVPKQQNNHGQHNPAISISTTSVRPCPLVVPIENSLTATLPTLTDNRCEKHLGFLPRRDIDPARVPPGRSSRAWLLWPSLEA